MGYLAKNDPIDSYVIKSFGEDLYPKGKLATLLDKTDEFRRQVAMRKKSHSTVTKKLITTSFMANAIKGS